MKILFAARAGNLIILGKTRAPDQARRRLSAAFGRPVTILWVGLPFPGIDPVSVIETAGSRLGKVSKLVDAELGSLTLAQVQPSRVIDREVINTTIGEAATGLTKPAPRSRQFWSGFQPFLRRVLTLGAYPSGASAS